jgi:tetratricopeptide (TPR) repeat protein
MSRWIFLPALLLVTGLLYGPSLSGMWHFDDTEAITESSGVQTDAWDLLRGFLAEWHHQPQQRSFSGVVYAFCYHFFGADYYHRPVGYHAVDLVLHLVATGLVYLLLRRIFLLRGRRVQAICFAGALFFGIHPVLSQTVIYIAATSSQLATLFALLALWISAVWLTPLSGTGGFLRYLSGALLLVVSQVLSASSKEEALPLPLLIGVFFVLTADHRRRGATAALVTLQAALLVLFVYRFYPSHVRSGVEESIATSASPSESPSVGSGGDTGGSRLASLLWRNRYLMSQAIVVSRYEWLFTYPTGLNVSYGKHHTPLMEGVDPRLRYPDSWKDPAVLGGGLLQLLLLGGTALALARRRWRWGGFAGLWFFVMLAPTSSFFAIIDPIFEHRLYLPAFGAALLVALGIDRLHGLAGSRLWFPVSAVVLLLASATWHRQGDWKDDYALWKESVRLAPYFYRAHNNLGMGYESRRQAPQSERQYLRSMRLVPPYLSTWIHPVGNLGNLYFRTGRFGRAISQYQKVLVTQTGDYKALANISTCYGKLGEPEEAVIFAVHSAVRRWDLPNVRGQLARRLEGSGVPASEIPGRMEDWKHRYDSALLWQDRGASAVEAKRWDEADACFRRALELFPGLSGIWKGMGMTAMYGRGRPEQAELYLLKGIRYPPYEPSVYRELLATLVRQRKMEEFAQRRREALALFPQGDGS